MTSAEPVGERWWEWNAGERGGFTVGVEEEAMLLDATTCALAFRIESVLPRLPRRAARQTTSETHGAAVETQTKVHATALEAAAELAQLRAQIEETVADLDLLAAGAGTHPFAVWQESVVTEGERAELVHGSMRALARREPTFAQHVHVGVPDPDQAIAVANRMRVHGPLLLALSANSPFWQGRETGLASARTPLFQAFPRVGVPRVFADYDDYVRTVDLLIRTDAIPEPTFLWWDVRLQPRIGTVEIRVMDTQTTVDEALALAALVQCLVRLECEEGYTSEGALGPQEAIDENRFLAARDGVKARLIDPLTAERVPLQELTQRLVVACRPHAQDLGCEAELLAAAELASENGAVRQRRRAAGGDGLPELVRWLAESFRAGRGEPAP